MKSPAPAQPCRDQAEQNGAAGTYVCVGNTCGASTWVCVDLKRDMWPLWSCETFLLQSRCSVCPRGTTGPLPNHKAVHVACPLGERKRLQTGLGRTPWDQGAALPWGFFLTASVAVAVSKVVVLYKTCWRTCSWMKLTFERESWDTQGAGHLKNRTAGEH